MKRLIFTAFTLSILSFAACNSTENTNSEQPAADTNINQHPTVVQQDSAVLSDDSATVKTAEGVKLEEQNAIQQEKKEAKKLEADEKK